ncbi:MAG: hypothetical protein ABIB43_00995 [archaeon]
MIEINKFIKQFTDKKIPNIQKNGREYFLVELEQEKLSKEIDKEIFSKGILLGEMKKRFKPSPALIDLLAKLSNRKAFITKDAEWLFLCGRDVFESSIVKKNVDEGVVLVQNERDENLGFGLLEKKKGRFMIKNILDKGAYLRSKN